jgi:hypothetical protein
LKNINKLIYFLFLITLLFTAKSFSAEKEFIYKSSNFITTNLIDLDSHIFVYFKDTRKKNKRLENFNYFPEVKDNFILVEEYKTKKTKKIINNDFSKYLKKLSAKETLNIKYDEKADLYLSEVNIKNVKNWEYIEVVKNKATPNIFKANIRENILSNKHHELFLVTKTENYAGFLKMENEKKNYKKLFLHSKGKSAISSIKFYKHIYHDNYYLSDEYQVAKTIKFLELKEFQNKIEQEIISETFEKVNRILNNFNYNEIYIKNKIATDDDFNLYYIYIKKDSNTKNSKVTISDFKKLIKNFQENNFSVDEIGYFK